MMDCTYDGLEARISILKSAAFVLEQEVERLEKMRDIVKARARDIIETEEKDTPIEMVGFSDRCWRALKRNGIDTVSKLEGHTVKDLMKLRNIGKKTATVIIREFEEYKKNKESEEE